MQCAAPGSSSIDPAKDSDRGRELKPTVARNHRHPGCHQGFVALTCHYLRAPAPTRVSLPFSRPSSLLPRADPGSGRRWLSACFDLRQRKELRYTPHELRELLPKSNLYVGPPVPDRARALRNLVVRPTGTLSSSSLAGRASRVTPGLEPSQNDRTSRPQRAGGDHATRRTRCTRCDRRLDGR